MTEQTSNVPNPTPFQSAGIVFVLVLMVVVPAILTLRTIDVPAKRTFEPDVQLQPSPYGYTVSLLLWIVPLVVLGFWLIPHASLAVPKKAFYITVILVFLLGGLLDFFFAQFFFRFPNPGATLGISAPALGSPVPIEEYVFYLAGANALILMYMWFDQYWLAAYRPVFRMPDRLIQFHPLSGIVAVALIAAAYVCRQYVVKPSDPGFPGYATFLVLVALLPSAILFRAARPLINWRAFTMTLMFVLLISLLWEATLAMAYGWWDYRRDQMIGIEIGAWHKLPLEAVVLWMAVCYAGILLFTAVRTWLDSRLPLMVALFGRK